MAAVIWKKWAMFLLDFKNFECFFLYKNCMATDETSRMEFEN